MSGVNNVTSEVARIDMGLANPILNVMQIGHSKKCVIIIIKLMSIEFMLLAVNLNFLLFSVYLDDLVGHSFY